MKNAGGNRNVHLPLLRTCIARPSGFPPDALAAVMGDHSVVLVRGHGSVAAPQSIHHVVFRAVYTEVNARMQAEAIALGTPRYLSAEEAAAAAKSVDTLVERPWAMWKQHTMGKS